MKANEYPSPDGMQKANDAPTKPSKDKPITRRDFVAGIGKLIAIGALSHFSLLAGKALAGETDCDCESEGSNDWCPYGEEDKDKCEPDKGNEDVCLDGSNDDDKCPNNKPAEDQCSSGEGWQDKCPSDGGVADGDNCYGGGATSSGGEQDTCKDDGSGDECSGGNMDGNPHTHD